ncbi:MAG: transposase, partial [Rikenellaceae bacterium]
MYVKRKLNRSGTTSVVVGEKHKGKYQKLLTIGVSSVPKEIEEFVSQGKKWIRKEELRRNPEFDFDGVETSDSSDS